MEFRNVQPRLFVHSMVGMGPKDRFHDKRTKTNYKPILRDDVGYAFVHETNCENKMFLAHAEIYKLLDEGKASLHIGTNGPAQQRIRAIFGDKKFEDFKPTSCQLALYREWLILRYEKECHDLDRDVPRTTALLEGFHQEWLDLNTRNGATGRADRVVQFALFPCPSVSTFNRDYSDYIACDRDVMALLPRHHGPGDKPSSLPIEALAFARKSAEGYLDLRRPGMAHVYRAYKAALAEHNAVEGAPEIQKVSRKVFEGLIARFDKFRVVASRYGEAFAIKKFMAIRRSFMITVPGQRVEMDYVTVDLMSLLVETVMYDALPDDVKERIPRVRICFCAAIDVATRYILALKASTNPNAVTATATLRMVMSDKRHISTYVGAATPWIGKVRPWHVVTDNGSEFTAGRLLDALRDAKIGGTRPPAGQPARRPFIESVFHTISGLIAAYFEGRTFSNVLEKGDYKPEERATLLVDELIKVFIFAVCDIYHNLPHSGLGGNTPHNAWVQANEEYEVRYPPGAEEMLQIFGLKSKATLSDYGITKFGITYVNEELDRLRASLGNAAVDIKFDPECPAHILVRGKKDWFAVPNNVGLDETVSLAEWIAARDELRAHYATAAENGMKAMNDAINRLRDIGLAATLRAGLKPSTASEKDYDRWESELFGAWRVAPSDDAPRLTVEGILPDDPLRVGMVVQRPDLFVLPKEKETSAEAVETAGDGGRLGSTESGFDYDDY